MIPKKIHYCWLSGEEMPAPLAKCVSTWKQTMPDYELVLWDKNRFDVNSVQCVKEACRIKYWAHAADYIRLYALYTEGGIYLDSDCIVLKRFDEFLQYGFFSGIEWHYSLLREPYTRKMRYRRAPPGIVPGTPWMGLQAAIMGGEAGHPFLKDCLDWFKDNETTILPAKINVKTAVFEALAPEIYASIAAGYGFVSRDIEQKLSHNMAVFPSSVFAGDVQQAGATAYAVHCCASEWRKNGLYVKLAKNKVLRKLLGKKPLSAAPDFFDMFQMFYGRGGGGITIWYILCDIPSFRERFTRNERETAFAPSGRTKIPPGQECWTRRGYGTLP